MKNNPWHEDLFMVGGKPVERITDKSEETANAGAVEKFFIKYGRGIMWIIIAFCVLYTIVDLLPHSPPDTMSDGVTSYGDYHFYDNAQ